MGQLTAFAAIVFFTASASWAQTTAPGGTGAPAGGTAATGGIGDYWWIILVILAAIAIWYFMRSRRNRTGV